MYVGTSVLWPAFVYGDTSSQDSLGGLAVLLPVQQLAGQRLACVVVIVSV